MIETEEKALKLKGIESFVGGSSETQYSAFLLNQNHTGLRDTALLKNSNIAAPTYTYVTHQYTTSPTLEDIQNEITQMKIKLSVLKGKLQRLTAEANNEKTESRLKNLFKKD